MVWDEYGIKMGPARFVESPAGRRPREGLTSRFQICAHLPVKTGTYVGGGDTFSLMQRSSSCAPYAVRLAEYQARPSGSTRSNWILDGMRPSTLHCLYADHTRSCWGVFRTVVQAPRRRTPKRTARARSKFIGSCLPEDRGGRVITNPSPVRGCFAGAWRLLPPRPARVHGVGVAVVLDPVLTTPSSALAHRDARASTPRAHFEPFV